MPHAESLSRGQCDAIRTLIAVGAVDRRHALASTDLGLERFNTAAAGALLKRGLVASRRERRGQFAPLIYWLTPAGADAARELEEGWS